MKLLLLALIFTAALALSHADNAANLGDFPYHASLWIHDEEYNRLCDGVLIRYNWVLTAAHCIYNATSTYVRLGSTNLMLGSEWYSYIEDPSTFYVADTFRADTPYINDIGLIFMAEADASIVTSPYIATINFLTDTGATLDYLSSVATGFGPSIDDYSTVLRSIRTPIMTQSWCQLVHGTRIDSLMMCTDNTETVSLCLEDSGAPLTATVGGQNLVVGIGSVWAEQCTNAHHGVFTRVANHADWITRTVNSRA